MGFAQLHARELALTVDQELLHLAAMLHDLGLMVAPRPGTNYLTRTLELARSELSDAELDDDQWKLLEESLLYNHAMRPPHRLVPQAEAFRRAVFTEHSHGTRRFGVPKADVAEVYDRIAWENFSAVLADFIWKTTVFEPTTIAQIFFPRGR